MIFPFIVQGLGVSLLTLIGSVGIVAYILFYVRKVPTKHDTFMQCSEVILGQERVVWPYFDDKHNI